MAMHSTLNPGKAFLFAGSTTAMHAPVRKVALTWGAAEAENEDASNSSLPPGSKRVAASEAHRHLENVAVIGGYYALYATLPLVCPNGA